MNTRVRHVRVFLATTDFRELRNNLIRVVIRKDKPGSVLRVTLSLEVEERTARGAVAGGLSEKS